MKSHLPRLRKRPSSCFCFVLNHVVLTGSLPFELIPGHFIDRANDMEAEQIRNTLREYPFLSHRAYAYEFDRRDGTYSKRLTSKNWRYWVVRLSSPDDERIDDLQHALNLHQASLELGMMFSPHGVTSRVLELIQFYFEPDQWMPNSPAVPVSAFEGIRNVCEMVLTVTQAHPELGRILADFELLKCLPRASRFYALGHFMVLEAVLTHNPESTADSLAHQICTKMPLLEKRFAEPLDYGGFQSVPHERIWKALYEYRSTIAHGGVPNFAKGRVSCLTHDKAVIQFMRAAVRSLLLVAVREPVLVTDLKAV